MARPLNAWKACNRHKRFPSSNLGHSAKKRRHSDFFSKDNKGIKASQKVAVGAKKTAKQPQRMRKVRVSLYFGRSFDKNGTAPLCIAVNHASSSCYIPMPGVRLRREQWDKVRKRVINHSQADTINSVALSTLAKANEAVMQLGNVRGMTTALTLEQMRQLWHYTPATEAQAYALDIFKLVFALIGINMADLCQLQGISQGRINYTRQKTGRVYSIKVEDVAKRLIKAHRGRKSLVDILEHYKNTHIATAQINKQLKSIAGALDLPPITTYTARYTWATLAASIDVPIEVISQALGHTYGMAVTLGYIMPDRRKVDEANSKVLGEVVKSIAQPNK